MDKKPLFEVRCGFRLTNNLYIRSTFGLKGNPIGIISWPFGKIKVYRDRIDLVPFPPIRICSIPLKSIVSIKSSFFGTIVTLNDSQLPKYVLLIPSTFFFKNRLVSQLKTVSEKYHLNIKFE